MTLWRLFPTVLMLDCTYRKNEQGLVAMHLMGLSGLDITFTIAIALVKPNRPDWHTHALRQVLELVGFPKDEDKKCRVEVVITDRDAKLIGAAKTVLPGAHCMSSIVHLKQQVQSAASKVITRDVSWQVFVADWHANVVEAKDKTAMEKGWEFMDRKYAAEWWKPALAYIHALSDCEPGQDSFVHAITDRHHHFGQRSVSRRSARHSKVNAWLAGNAGDLVRLVEGLGKEYLFQWETICDASASQMIRTPAYMQPYISHVSARCIWTPQKLKLKLSASQQG